MTIFSYCAHSRAPWVHSWYKPANRISKKNIPVSVHVMVFVILKILASGSRRVISTSKIRNTIAIRKKRSEKGSRADPLGSNPHSNGEFFSRSLMVFLEIKEERTMIAIDRMSVRDMSAVIIRIASPVITVFLVGSQIYLYVY